MKSLESRAKHREPPFIVPTDLIGRRYTCNACGTAQEINWFHKQAFPAESVASSVEPGHWVPVSFSNTCDECSHRNVIPVETKEFRGPLLISADEAARDVSDRSLFLIAGCGISPHKRNAVEKRIQSLEERLTRDSDGRVTTFHAKDIMDQRLWPSTSLSQRIKFIRQMSSIARTNCVSIFVTAGALIAPEAKEKLQLRDQVFSAYCLRVLERTTANSIQPFFAFDEVQRGKKNGWAEECMIGIRRYPLFVWYSRGAHPLKFST